ncbi:hypothetical protein Glove_66g132 [Diversispora epigaea]|uniref:Uncharacterized protein n=1 Tax=Diversispora epigaea TaxID=1348612 RepID=A0A397JJN9_9GLOM|nr:hypothetical protein Glove_66g132 [Diversispora epigaea]
MVHITEKVILKQYICRLVAIDLGGNLKIRKTKTCAIEKIILRYKNKMHIARNLRDNLTMALICALGESNNVRFYILTGTQRYLVKSVSCDYDKNRFSVLSKGGQIFIWGIKNSHVKKDSTFDNYLNEECLEKLNLEFERIREIM